MRKWSLASDRLRGWVAVYARGDSPYQVFTSKDTDPEDLPGVDLQYYYVFHKQRGKMWSNCFSGYDEVSMLGRRERVLGAQLTNERFFGEITELGHQIHATRGDYANEVLPAEHQH